MEECFDTYINNPIHNLKLKAKEVAGEVYILTCNAGTYVQSPETLLYKMKDRNLANHLMNDVFKSKFSTLRFFAYICPDADVIGIKDDSVDYDDTRNKVMMPTTHGYLSWAGDFVSEHYDSKNDVLLNTTIIGGDDEMAERYYAS